MSEESTTTEPVEANESTDEQQEPVEATEAHETAEQPAEDQEAGQADDEASKPAREAAKYRRQLRETEAERDTLKEQVTTLRRSIAEEALSGVLAKPSALWLTGADPSSFYDDSGNLDTEALVKAAKEAAAENGLQPHRRFGGSADGGTREDAQAPRRFADMFRPAS